jgi:hypothetical protein
MRKFKVSERRACALVGQRRSTNRYVPAPGDFEVKLVARMTQLAERRPWWGCRVVHGLLVAEGWPVNKKAGGTVMASGGPASAPAQAESQWAEGGRRDGEQHLGAASAVAQSRLVA